MYKTLANENLTTVWITDTTLVLGLDFVPHSWIANSRTTPSSTSAGILAICLRSVSSRAANERDWVGQILEVGFLPTRSYQRGRQACLYAPLSGSKQPYALEQPSTNEAQLAGIKRASVLNVVTIHRPSSSIPDELLTALIFFLVCFGSILLFKIISKWKTWNEN